MLQLIANQNYHGFLAIENQWAIAILLKHLLFFSMILLSAYITWGLMPQLHRLALRQARGQQTGESDILVMRLHRQEVLLLRLNLVLGVLILALTAIARAT
jgi:hypothetical protein